MFLRLSSTSL